MLDGSQATAIVAFSALATAMSSALSSHLEKRLTPTLQAVFSGDYIRAAEPEMIIALHAPISQLLGTLSSAYKTFAKISIKAIQHMNQQEEHSFRQIYDSHEELYSAIVHQINSATTQFEEAEAAAREVNEDSRNWISGYVLCHHIMSAIFFPLFDAFREVGSLILQAPVMTEGESPTATAPTAAAMLQVFANAMTSYSERISSIINATNDTSSSFLQGDDNSDTNIRTLILTHYFTKDVENLGSVFATVDVKVFPDAMEWIGRADADNDCLGYSAMYHLLRGNPGLIFQTKNEEKQ